MLISAANQNISIFFVKKNEICVDFSFYNCSDTLYGSYQYYPHTTCKIKPYYVPNCFNKEVTTTTTATKKIVSFSNLLSITHVVHSGISFIVCPHFIDLSNQIRRNFHRKFHILPVFPFIPCLIVFKCVFSYVCQTHFNTKFP